jgi:hypothetical protein
MNWNVLQIRESTIWPSSWDMKWNEMKCEVKWKSDGKWREDETVSPIEHSNPSGLQEWIKMKSVEVQWHNGKFEFTCGRVHRNEWMNEWMSTLTLPLKFFSISLTFKPFTNSETPFIEIITLVHELNWTELQTQPVNWKCVCDQKIKIESNSWNMKAIVGRIICDQWSLAGTVWNWDCINICYQNFISHIFNVYTHEIDSNHCRWPQNSDSDSNSDDRMIQPAKSNRDGHLFSQKENWIQRAITATEMKRNEII